MDNTILVSLRDYFAINAMEEDIKPYIPATMDERKKLMLSLKMGKCKDAMSDNECIQLLQKLKIWARYKFADDMLTEKMKGLKMTIPRRK